MSEVEAPNLDSYLPRFRLASFRPGQREVIEAVLAGEDCLCVMPTGGGKSLCYQLPALALDGLTLVVSPLIALMQDQVGQLQALGLPATFINSTLTMAEQQARLENISRGRYRLVYVVPERFRSPRFLEAVHPIGVKLLAIDEAHCISEWGHDFRPDYSRLGMFRRRFGSPTTIALTATATDAVRRDIVEQLHLRNPRILVTGFARPNLFYEVWSPRSERQKAEMLIRFLRRTPGTGIVYASTRKRTEEIAGRIAGELGRSTVAYHAGLLPDERRRAQEAFMRGRIEIVAATTAFGMGIDKADVRFVVHYNLPGSLEAYYQEAGRAGRDGKPSRCLLLYHASDRYLQEYFIESAYPAREMVARVYDCLRAVKDDPIELTQQEIKERLSLPIGSEGVGTCEQLLESAGVLERLVASQNRAAVRVESDLPTLLDLLPKQAKVRRRVLRAVEDLVGTRRHEMVFVHPRELRERSGLDHPSVTHALRELNRLEAFTYVPPFRGRAIRMIRRDVPFDELEIDFDTLERRKAAEYGKLNQVMYYAISPRCRQEEILRYFGDRRSAPCGHCDNCGQRPASTEAVPARQTAVDGKLLEAVRMVLSGVARSQLRLTVGCGKNLLAQMLCGSASAKMRKLGLDSLSTFGLLQHLSQPEVATLVDGLVVTGHLEQTEFEPRRPVIQLTPLGSDLMKGKAELEAAPPIPPELLHKIRGSTLTARPDDRGGSDVGRPPEPAPEAAQGDALPPADPELLRALRAWRDKVAVEASLPAYCVLSNATIDELARRRPASSERLLAVRGIGPAKLEKYGDALLAMLRPADSEAAGDAPASPEAKGALPPETPWWHASSEESPADTPGAGGPRAEGSPAEGPQSEQPAPGPPSPEEPARPGNGRRPSTSSEGGKSARPPADRPSHYWTWRLLSDGFSADECGAIRGIGRDVIVDHLLRAAEQGLPVRPEWCLSETLLRELRRLVTSEAPEPIASLLSQLPAGTRHEELRLFLLANGQPAKG